MLATEKCQQQCYNEMEWERWGGGRTTDDIRVNKEYMKITKQTQKQKQQPQLKKNKHKKIQKRFYKFILIWFVSYFSFSFSGFFGSSIELLFRFALSILIMSLCVCVCMGVQFALARASNRTEEKQQNVYGKCSFSRNISKLNIPNTHRKRAQTI